MPSFTIQLPNIQAIGPVVEVRIGVGAEVEKLLTNDSKPVPTAISAHAMIDTGATSTVIRDDIAQKLGLQPVGVTFINTPSSTNVRCYEYLVRLLFPDNVTVEATAISAPLQGQHIQCLVGRDILTRGVLIYIGYMNSFTLSF